jgi:hypothetical protein
MTKKRSEMRRMVVKKCSSCLSLARICQALQCSDFYWQGLDWTGLDWTGLDWNTGGLAFYKKIGATIHEVQTSRYAGEALNAFANQS